MDLRKYLQLSGKKLSKNIVEALNKLKTALAEESEQTKGMFETYQRFVQGKATAKEMESANEQFRSFVKALGLGVLVILPFAPITIPSVIILGKKFGIDILPNSIKKMGKGA